MQILIFLCGKVLTYYAICNIIKTVKGGIQLDE
nr:MAG TPA: hypothetical protein [Caudoviricetes sp.]